MMSFQNSQALLFPNNYKIWNLGNSESRSLTDYIKIIEDKTGKKARMLHLGKQRGDILETYADNSLLLHDFGDHDFVPIEMGISKFIEWYVNHYRLER
jgi:UDP-glucuronate 4-epimerase